MGKLFLQKKSIEEAKRDYQRIWEEVKPFIKKRIIKQYSTTGKWLPTYFNSRKVGMQGDE